jgi:hypothetical protein
MGPAAQSPVAMTGYEKISRLLADVINDIAERQALVEALNARAEQIRPMIPTDEDLGKKIRASGEARAFILTYDHQPSVHEQRLKQELEAIEAAAKIIADNARFTAETLFGEILGEVTHHYRGQIPARVPKSKTAEQHFLDNIHPEDQRLFRVTQQGIEQIQRAKAEIGPTMEAVTLAAGSLFTYITQGTDQIEAGPTGRGAMRRHVRNLLSVHRPDPLPVRPRLQLTQAED